MATKRYRQAVIAYQKCRDVFQGNAAAVVGNEMAYQRRIDDQIQALEDQKRSYSQVPGRNANSPASLANIQQLDMQISQMRDLRRRTAGGPEPTPPWITIALGSAYFRTDAMADAEREYRAAVAVAPNLGEAHNNLAVVYMLTRRFDEAEAEIKAAEKAGFKVNPQLKDDLKKAKP
jgi:tetratricopeptide (TPR) repeat protein